MEHKTLGKKVVNRTQMFVTIQNISFIRKTILVCIFSYSLFGILDYLVYPEHLKTFLLIRFGIVVPYLFFLYGISSTKFFSEMREYLLIVLYFLAGMGIVIMVYIIGGDNFYTNGLFLVFGIGFYLIRLKIQNSLIAFFSVIIGFSAIEVITGSMTTQEVLVNLVFFVSFGGIGIFGGYFNDKYIQAQVKYEDDVNEEKINLEEQINQQLQKINLQLEEINTAHVETIYSLAKLAESRDKLTSDHLSRVGDLAYVLAGELPSDLYKENHANKQQILESISLSSILHDIGKISISDEILNKPGKLTKEEFDIMKTHTSIGAETLISMRDESLKNNFVVMGIEIALYHHEKWDGSGYPTGISGKDIPLSARIIAIIDVYDALISKRPYKEKYSKEKSLRIMEEGTGTHFDPIIVETFIRIARQSNDETLFWK